MTICYRIEKEIETKVDYEAQIREEERKAIGVYLRKELYWHCNTTDIDEITRALLAGRFPTWCGDDYLSPSPERIGEVNQVLGSKDDSLVKMSQQVASHPKGPHGETYSSEPISGATGWQ